MGVSLTGDNDSQRADDKAVGIRLKLKPGHNKAKHSAIVASRLFHSNSRPKKARETKEGLITSRKRGRTEGSDDEPPKKKPNLSKGSNRNVIGAVRPNPTGSGWQVRTAEG